MLRLGLITFCLVITGCNSSGTSESQSEVRVVKNLKTGYTDFQISQQHCQIKLSVAKGTNSTAKLQSKCEMSGEVYKENLDKLLDQIMLENGGDLPFKNYAMGRLLSNQPYDKYEVSRRLAAAVLSDGSFNSLNMADNEGMDLPGYIQNVLESESLLYDYKSLFLSRGYRISKIKITNVLVDGVVNVPHLEPLLAEGAKAYEVVPYDAMVWLEIEKN